MTRPTPQLGADLLGFIQTDDWQAARDYLHAHPHLMTHPGVAEIVQTWLAQAEDDQEKRILATHYGLLGWCAERGIDAGFEAYFALRNRYPDLPTLPPDLLAILGKLTPMAPSRQRAYLDANPIIRDQLVDLGILKIVQNTSLESVILAFLNASTWQAKRHLLENNQRALFSAAAVIFFEEELAKQVGNSVNTLMLQAHQQLLTRCQEIGIGAAFEEAQAALRNAPDDDQP